MYSKRLYIFFVFFVLFSSTIVARLFYWQIIRGDELATLAQKQRLKVEEIKAPRGKIYTAHQHPLVLNKPSFAAHLYTPNTNKTPKEIAENLAPILTETKEASLTAQKEDELIDLIESPRKWLILDKNVSPEQKQAIEQLAIDGVGFEERNERDYPEASMSAHLLGFVGKNKNNQPQGYFGIEGFYHQQLSGSGGLIMGEKNPFGQSIFSGHRIQETMEPGYNLTLNIERTAQYILEDELKTGIEKHGAKSGWGIVMNPHNGKIYAMASFPKYSPSNYAQAEKERFPNPVVASGFEPGSIFKPLIMAAALEENKVTPDTTCPICDGPLTIGDATIKTWNEEYHPNSTMTDVIVNSDNVGMAFVGQRLGKEKLLTYINNLGFGQKTGIDLQEEAGLSIRPRNEWYPIDVAAASFGQGVLITPMQFTRAFAAIANNGYLVQPQVVKEIWQEPDKSYQPETNKSKQVYSSESCNQITEMMVKAVEEGGTKWIDKQGLSVAGKTGTAQIPVKGHYDEEKTIASFTGFMPTNNPKFVMLISLREPQSSPWGSETAAPVWFNIAKRLAYYWNLK
jgi:cell division protein FtsI/penicillin-binding protein 2